MACILFSAKQKQVARTGTCCSTIQGQIRCCISDVIAGGDRLPSCRLRSVSIGVLCVETGKKGKGQLYPKNKTIKTPLVLNDWWRFEGITFRPVF